MPAFEGTAKEGAGRRHPDRVSSSISVGKGLNTKSISSSNQGADSHPGGAGGGDDGESAGGGGGNDEKSGGGTAGGGGGGGGGGGSSSFDGSGGDGDDQSKVLTKKRLAYIARLFKPYNGDLFSQRTKNDEGLLYLSRLDPSRDPRKAKAATKEGAQRKESLHGELTSEEAVTTEASMAQRAAGDARLRRLAVSLATLTEKPEKRVGVVDKGAIAALSKLSHCTDSRTRMSCGLAFNNLASESQVRQRMIDQEAHLHIIALALTTHSKALKKTCLEALCNLAAVKGCENRLVSDGLPSAVLAIHRAAPHLLELCLKTLINMSACKMLVKVDEINDATIHLSTVTESGSYNEHLLLQLVCNLSSLKNNQQPLVEEGTIRIVAKAADNNGASPATIRLCAHTLCNFAADARCRTKMADSSTTKSIALLCDVEEVAVKREVAHTIALLATESTCREKMLHFGIIPVVITMCKDLKADVIVRRFCALALVVLAQDKPFAEFIVAGGAMPALLLLSRRNDEETQAHCAHCLCTLIKSGMDLDYLLEQGVMGALIALARATWQETKAWAALAMYLIFVRPGMVDAPLVSNGAIVAALLGMAKEGNTVVCKLCVAAIWTLTKINPCIERAQDAILVLLDLLQKEGNAEIKADCAAALYGLARNPFNCAIMIEAGALLPIISLAEVGSFHTKVQCMSILQRMLLSHTLPAGVITKSFVSTLQELSRLEHIDTQQRIVISIFLISREEEGRRLLMEVGAPEHLIRLISKPNEEMRTGCAAILCNLSSDPGQELAITSVGGVKVLLITAMVACDSLLCRCLCAKAVMNLLFAESAHAGMVTDGVVWGLAVMSGYEDLQVQRLCAFALCHLSRKFWTEIATPKSMAAVYTLCKSEDAETCRLAVKTINNILLLAKASSGDGLAKSVIPVKKTAASVRQLERLERVSYDSVHILPAALESKDVEVRRAGLRIAFLVSTVAKARGQMLQHRILEQLAMDDIMQEKSMEPLLFAYSCMLTNLALDVNARNAVLDTGTFSAFGELSMLSERICTQLAQVLYASSCGADNGALVTDHDVITLIGIFLQAPTLPSAALKYLSAVTLNLSCCDQAREEAVRKGCARLCFLMWKKSGEAMQEAEEAETGTGGGVSPTVAAAAADAAGGGWGGGSRRASKEVQDFSNIRREQALALCNLSMGKVNTARMVQHGAGSVIMDLVHSSPSTELVDVPLRASAALRNLLCISGNHTQLAEEGVIPCLVRLAELGDSLVRNNCASALRSLTCKKEIRQVLIDCGAVDVILADASYQNVEMDSLSIDTELLCDIEAESWSNDIRGVMVESRSSPLPPLGLNESLLDSCRESSQNASEDQELHTVKWDKIQVQDITLQEPAIASDSVESTPSRFDSLDMGASAEAQLSLKPQYSLPPWEQKIEVSVEQRPKAVGTRGSLGSKPLALDDRERQNLRSASFHTDNNSVSGAGSPTPRTPNIPKSAPTLPPIVTTARG